MCNIDGCQMSITFGLHRFLVLLLSKVTSETFKQLLCKVFVRQVKFPAGCWRFKPEELVRAQVQPGSYVQWRLGKNRSRLSRFAH